MEAEGAWSGEATMTGLALAELRVVDDVEHTFANTE